MEKSQINSRKPLNSAFLLVLALCTVGWQLYCISHTRTTVSSSSIRTSSCTSTVPSISLEEFTLRQDALARILHSRGAAAYIAEPGADTQFFGNFSQDNWFLSERPLLLIVTPDAANSTIRARISLLTPKFESTRARSLPLPNLFSVIEWPEEADPYLTALTALSLTDTYAPIFVDSAIRMFIADGLHGAAPSSQVLSAPAEVLSLRERKSKGEIDIMKCAHETTLETIRAVHIKMTVGMHESEARNMMADGLASAGLKNGHCLTLFGENAALPHGSGTDRKLAMTDFALFDCTASLHGYWSDVTRTVALVGSEKYIPQGHLRIWQSVKWVQRIAHQNARAGRTTGSVDESARMYMRFMGYEQYFTHRLGHGIGLEVHEGPYLRGGSDAVIEQGHTFSNEPGVYIEGEVGVRLEDCFYIDELGESVYLTSGPSETPWLP